MSFRAPAPTVERGLIGDGVYYELDMCLQATARGRILYNHRVAVDHYLAARNSVGDPAAHRFHSDPEQVRSACYNLAFVLSKHTKPRLQRLVRLLYLVLVGQRRCWGVASIAVALVSGELKAGVAVRLLGVATSEKRKGWVDGGRRRAPLETWDVE